MLCDNSHIYLQDSDTEKSDGELVVDDTNEVNLN